MRYLTSLMFATLWISGCAIVPVALTMGVEQALYCITVFLIASVYFFLPISERS
jgi:anaerobic C4-dicarboxylate transporter